MRIPLACSIDARLAIAVRIWAISVSSSRTRSGSLERRSPVTSTQTPSTAATRPCSSTTGSPARTTVRTSPSGRVTRTSSENGDRSAQAASAARARWRSAGWRRSSSVRARGGTPSAGTPCSSCISGDHHQESAPGEQRKRAATGPGAGACAGTPSGRQRCGWRCGDAVSTSCRASRARAPACHTEGTRGRLLDPRRHRFRFGTDRNGPPNLRRRGSPCTAAPEVSRLQGPGGRTGSRMSSPRQRRRSRWVHAGAPSGAATAAHPTAAAAARARPPATAHRPPDVGRSGARPSPSSGRSSTRPP